MKDKSKACLFLYKKRRIQWISCRVVLDKIKEQNWVLTVSRYVHMEENFHDRRAYSDIVIDINKIARLRNALKKEFK